MIEIVAIVVPAVLMLAGVIGGIVVGWRVRVWRDGR